MEEKDFYEEILADHADRPPGQGAVGAEAAMETPDGGAVAPSSFRDLQENASGDQQVAREMVARMEELTEEIRRLRERLEEIPRADSLDPAVAVQEPSKEQEKKKPRGALSVISSIAFYVIIAMVVFGAFLIKSSSGGKPTLIAGYSAFTVLTGSMEDVYPRGSLIITKSVDANTLEIGDDITYMVSETSSITHRIIGITENYLGTGQRAFETQGVMNPKPDKELVAASNVVGEVVFHSKTLGDMAAFVSKNWPFLVFLLVVMVALISFLKWNAKERPSDTEDTKKKRTKKQESLAEENADDGGE